MSIQTIVLKSNKLQFKSNGTTYDVAMHNFTKEMYGKLGSQSIYFCQQHRMYHSTAN